jgi:hypothetical protein
MASTDQSVLLAELFVEELDFSESDPTCKEGFRVVYAKEVPFEMRLQETEEAPQEVGTLEAILAKVAVQGDPAAPTAIKVELSSESDLFFHYSHVVDERAFKQLREEQRLMIEFNDYANVLARSLNQAIKEPQTHLAVYIMNRDGQARLDFIQNMEYKFVELLSVAFLRSPDDLIRQAVAFRYNSLKAKVQVLTSRLSEVTSIVKIKNPSRASPPPPAAPLRLSPPNPRAPPLRPRSAASASAEPRADGGGGGRRYCSWQRRRGCRT